MKVSEEEGEGGNESQIGDLKPVRQAILDMVDDLNVTAKFRGNPSWGGHR